MENVLHQMAAGYRELHGRSPILHTPDEAGLAYENVSFPATDGVPLEGWPSGPSRGMPADSPRSRPGG